MNGCSGMMGHSAANIELCAPLQQLKAEHGPLRNQMDEYKALAGEIGQDESQHDWAQPLQALYEKVHQFMSQLDVHSRKEEDVLFVMMANYIGRHVGPIAVMEYEHDSAKTLLKSFLETAGSIDGPVAREQAIQIADTAIQAQAILTEHFMKEENVLFPMAEQMLTAEEKEYLQKEIAKIA